MKLIDKLLVEQKALERLLGGINLARRIQKLHNKWRMAILPFEVIRNSDGS